jgi:hypothetical protein
MMPWAYGLLYPLVDGLYDRQQPMLEKHLDSFTAGLELTYSLAASREEIDEYHRFVKWWAKCEISHQTYPINEFSYADWEAKKRLRNPNESPYDGHPCSLMGKLLTLGWQGVNGKEGEIYFNNIVRPFVDKFQQLRLREIERFNVGIYQQFGADSINSRLNLIEYLVTQNGERLGFARNKKLTRPKKLVYTKTINGDIEVFWGIDLGRLLEASVEPLRPGLLRPQPGPDFLMFFGLLDKKKTRSLTMENQHNLFLRFMFFFPIEKGLHHWTTYRRFYNLKELEAVININVTLYEILMNEFENALKGHQVRL